MGFFRDIVGGAVKGIKNLFDNARVGRDAKATGFVAPNYQQVQEQQNALLLKSAQSTGQNSLLVWVLGGVGVLFALFVLISKKR